MNDNSTHFTSYIQKLRQVLDRLPLENLEEIYHLLQDARDRGSAIYVCGNGGSASTASHMVCDLSKNIQRQDKPRLRVMGLNDNIPTLTAYANDEGYDRIFAEPVLTYMEEGDVLIAISASGESENVLQGVRAAQKKGAKTVGLTGYDGGRLKDWVDLCFIVPSQSIERIEDIHLVVNHLLTVALRENL